MQGTLDADRLATLHVPVAQINTDPGFGGECHLDANMVRSALPSLPLDELDLLVIENVGNLVCPAEFRVGEDRRVMVSSVTEGEDKPLKYPLMFRACELVLVNKIDLLPHLDFDLDRFLGEPRRRPPGRAAAARERADGRGRRRVARRGSSARRRASARPCDPEARVDELLARRGDANARFFEAEAERLARLCRGLAERFARGGRLLALGGSPQDVVGRAPRRGRVRPPGDRRQARAARARARARTQRRAARAARRHRRSPSSR